MLGRPLGDGRSVVAVDDVEEAVGPPTVGVPEADAEHPAASTDIATTSTARLTVVGRALHPQSCRGDNEAWSFSIARDE